jgi:hydroxymethylglutaryl-CoA reductase
MTAAVSHAPVPAEACGVAWGKVILLGEHSVVYGRRALASAISRRIEVRIGDVYSRANGNGRPNPHHTDPRFRAAIKRAGELLDIDASDLIVHVDSDLPAGVGLGSSAALSVALVRGMAAFAGVDCCHAEVCAHAYELERIFHGTPSGIDNTAATHGGLFVFRRGEPPRQLRTMLPLSLVVAQGKTPRQTQRTVAGVRERWQAEPQAYEALFDQIDRLVAAAEEALSHGDLTTLGATMNGNHALLQRIGVSTPELDQLVDFGHRHGALGAKLTGGGGGGAIICLGANRTEAERLAERYRAEGWEAFTTRVSSAGAPTREVRDRV